MTQDHPDDMNASLSLASFLQQEEGRHHHGYNEELQQYEYLRDGNMQAVEISEALFRSEEKNGKLSDNPLRNKQYLFVANTTLATRFAIEGGMQAQIAYNLSDLYIRRADRCRSTDEIYEIQTEMFRDFTQRMAVIHASASGEDMKNLPAKHFSKPVLQCMNYIYYHMNERITIPDIASEVKMSPNYLSKLFKDEVGMTIQTYIRRRKIESAEKMLLYSEYTLTDIGEFLSFSTTSYFIRVFREETGMTPREYQQKNFATHKRWSGKDGSV